MHSSHPWPCWREKCQLDSIGHLVRPSWPWSQMDGAEANTTKASQWHSHSQKFWTAGVRSWVCGWQGQHWNWELVQNSGWVGVAGDRDIGHANRSSAEQMLARGSYSAQRNRKTKKTCSHGKNLAASHKGSPEDWLYLLCHLHHLFFNLLLSYYDTVLFYYSPTSQTSLHFLCWLFRLYLTSKCGVSWTPLYGLFYSLFTFDRPWTKCLCCVPLPSSCVEI